MRTLKARRHRYSVRMADALQRAREVSQIIADMIELDPEIARNLATTEALDCIEAAIMHLDRVPKPPKRQDRPKPR